MAGILDTAPTGPFGVEVRGLDLSKPLTSDVADALRSLYDSHYLLVFRGQDLTHEQQLRFTEIFSAGDDAHIYGFVSNIEERGRLGQTDIAFHSDNSFSPEPYVGMCLHAVDLEDDRSATRFLLCRLSDVDMPADLASRLRSRHALHVFGWIPQGPQSEDVSGGVPHHVHPIVLKHPRTSEEILYASFCLTPRIVDLPPEESEAALKSLWDSLYVEEKQYVHSWRMGDVVLWDNIAVQHARGDVSACGDRTLQKTIIGRPFGAQYPDYRPPNAANWADGAVQLAVQL